MKIEVYHVVEVSPRNEEHRQQLCELINAPSLRRGSVRFASELSHFTNKTSLRSYRGVNSIVYRASDNLKMEGTLYTSHLSGETFFARYAFK